MKISMIWNSNTMNIWVGNRELREDRGLHLKYFLSEKYCRIFLKRSALSLRISSEESRNSNLRSRDILPSSRINFQYIADINEKRDRLY